MHDITRILSAANAGDPRVAEQILPLVYNELRRVAALKMAQETPGQTLDATALVHEAYIRLVESSQPDDWNSRGHFYAAAAEAMRRILVERARHKNSLKAGGEFRRVGLSEIQPAVAGPNIDVIALSEGLNKLAAQSERQATLVKLRFFAGLTNKEAAAILGISTTTADNDWVYARCWLQREMDADASERNPSAG